MTKIHTHDQGLPDRGPLRVALRDASRPVAVVDVTDLTTWARARRDRELAALLGRALARLTGAVGQLRHGLQAGIGGPLHFSH